MPTYTIETPRGKQVTLEADSPDAAMSGAQRWDLEDYASGEAQRIGVSPDLVLRQMNVESRVNPNAVSPKGARGPMQLMPGTAKDLGVDPSDPYQNITGGVTYLKHQLDTYGGDESKALAAYNAGPGAVNRAGGVPKFPETQAYVAALAGKTPQATPAAAGVARAPAAPPQAQHGPNGVSDAILASLAGLGKGIAGLADPVIQASPLGGVMDILRNGANAAALLQGHPSTSIAAPAAPMSTRAAQHDYQSPTLVGQILHTLGTMAPNALIPGSGMQRVANVVAPTLGQEGGSRLAKAAGGDANAQQIAGALGAMLGGGAASLRSAPKVATAGMSLEDLKTASDAAWKAVDNSTYAIPKADAQSVAKDIAQTVEDAGGKELYPNASAVSTHISSLAGKGDLTIGQLNRLKSQAGLKLLGPNSTEVDVGGEIKDKLEGLIVNSGDPSIGPARDLYTRLKKAQEVTNRTDSADLRAASTYAGGNQANATRQNLRPLIDPKSPQRLRNLTPDETAALNQVVRGTPTQNAMRTVGKLLDPRGLLGASLQTVMGIPTHGVSALTALPGMAASQASNKMTAGAVQELLDLITSGGVKPAAQAPLRIAATTYAGLAAPTSVALSAFPAMSLAKPRKPARR